MIVNMGEEEKEIVVNSINTAKTAIRTIQEKLYDEDIDPKSIFRITLKLNEYLDELAIKIHQKD